MSHTPDERRYSDDELRRILEEATAEEASPRAGAPAGARDGFTLAEIREIAREVGIEGGAIDRAAARVEAQPSPGTLENPGPFARALESRFSIGRPLTDAEMRDLALDASAGTASHATCCSSSWRA